MRVIGSILTTAVLLEPTVAAAVTPGAIPYVDAQYMSAPIRQPKSSTLGIIGFVGIMVWGIVLGALIYQVVVYGLEMGLLDPYKTGMVFVPINNLAKFGVVGNLGNVVLLLGFSAWITSIIATVTKRGRVWGIIGTAIGVFVPMIAVFSGLNCAMMAMGLFG